MRQGNRVSPSRQTDQVAAQLVARRGGSTTLGGRLPAIPDGLLYDSGLPASAVALWALIDATIGPRPAEIDLAEVARKLGIQRRDVRRRLLDLEAAGWLQAFTTPSEWTVKVHLVYAPPTTLDLPAGREVGR